MTTTTSDQPTKTSSIELHEDGHMLPSSDWYKQVSREINAEADRESRRHCRRAIAVGLGIWMVAVAGGVWIASILASLR